MRVMIMMGNRVLYVICKLFKALKILIIMRYLMLPYLVLVKIILMTKAMIFCRRIRQVKQWLIPFSAFWNSIYQVQNMSTNQLKYKLRKRTCNSTENSCWKTFNIFEVKVYSLCRGFRCNKEAEKEDTSMNSFTKTEYYSAKWWKSGKSKQSIF